MSRIIETIVYDLTELNRAARDKARNWYREHALWYDWYDCVYDDFKAVCTILGIKLKTYTVRLHGRGTSVKSCIYFSGFSSQGDGACFEARYAYAKGAARKIRQHAPTDGELHGIVDALQAVQRRNGYQLFADITHRDRYYHARSMTITVDRDGPAHDMTADADDAVTKAMRDLADWLYRRLESEYEHLTSDAVVDEAITANDYTFTETGQRFG